MQASLSSTRSFFSKATKFRNLHRRQKSGESSRKNSQVDVAPAKPVWHEEKESAPQPPAPPPEVDQRIVPAEEDVIIEEEEEEAEEEEAVEEQPDSEDPVDVVESDDEEDYVEMEPKQEIEFKGLSDYRLDINNASSLIDADYMESAFGITMDRTEAEAARPKTSHSTKANVMTPPESEDEVYEMYAPMPTIKERRPDLLVSIPTKGSRLQKVQSSSTGEEESGWRASKSQQQTPHVVSPTTARTPARPHKPFNGLATARLSIVSPLSVVEMPKPRRPFSALSLEGMTKDAPQTAPPVSKSANSTSSEDASEPDGKSSGAGHSPTSSMSSMNSETQLAKLREKSRRPSVTQSLHPQSSKTAAHMRSTVSLHTTPVKQQPQLRSKKSTSSMKSTTSIVNMNKPLPPEPGRMTGQTPSRSSSITVRQRQFTPEDATVKALSISRRGSKGSIATTITLKSKYTPKDLDALDDAFQRTNPPKLQVSFSNHTTPNHSQLSLALDGSLGTIKEDSPRDSMATAAIANSPLQISRGPMRMEPSRRPPQPPPRAGSPAQSAQDKLELRKKFMKRSVGSVHLASQLRNEQQSQEPQRRSSAMASTSSSKANRILGKSGSNSPVGKDRKSSVDSFRSLHDSPKTYTNNSSPTRSEHDNLELDGASAPDAHFEEIRKRLELLSPKDDPSKTFLAFHQNNSLFVEKKLGTTEQGKPEFAAVQYSAPLKPAGDNLHEHIAELEAHRPPSPVELEGSSMVAPVEIADTSPKTVATIPVAPPIPDDIRPLDRRGRADAATVHSTKSVSNRSLHSQRSIKARSLASLAMSEIPDLYAAITPPNATQRPSLSPEEVEQLISADAAERVLLRILQSLDNLKDLFAAAEVSRGFYRTFKRHELSLLRNALWRMSPAAWELREMSIPLAEFLDEASDYKPNMYFRHYVRDLLTMVELKAMILDNCKSFLRAETISGLSGETERSPIIDDAFWRVWTFCRIFGCGKDREDDIVGQMDWLKGGVLAKQQSTDTNTLALSDGVSMNSVLFNPPAGFAKGNGNGLTAEELYDMTEIWNCLSVLVRGYHGKRHEAREYGIFEGTSIAPGDVEKENAMLEEWTHHLLTLAPATVLDATSPATPTHTTFAHARSQGYTKWKIPSQGSSRSTFLKEAVSRVYEEKMSMRRPSLSAATSFATLPKVLPPVATAPLARIPEVPDPSYAARQRVAVHAAEIRKKKNDPKYKDVPVSAERPMSNFPDVLERLEALSTSAADAPPVPKIPNLPNLKNKFSFRNPKVTVTSPSKSSKSSKSKAPAVPPLPNVDTTTPGASPSRPSGGRLAMLKDKFEHRPSTPPSKTASPRKPNDESMKIEFSEEKLPVVDNSLPTSGSTIPIGPQVRDPVDLAVERLTTMGFDESMAKKALAETDTGNSVNFESALALLTRDKKRKDRLERLDRMG